MSPAKFPQPKRKRRGGGLCTRLTYSMTLGNTVLRLAALAVTLHIIAACSDYERFRGRTPEQAKQACDPQRQSPEECSRTLDK
jgi:hypothetical protein